MINLEELTYNYFLGDITCTLSVYIISYTPCKEGPACNLLCASPHQCERSVIHYVHRMCTSRQKNFGGTFVPCYMVRSSNGEPPSRRVAHYQPKRRSHLRTWFFYLFDIRSRKWPHLMGESRSLDKVVAPHPKVESRRTVRSSTKVFLQVD